MASASVSVSRLALGLGLIVSLVSIPIPARAHETKCPFCRKPVVQDTADLDNEVALKFGKKRIEYRCVLCAIAEAKTAYTGDLTIVAPTETKGQSVTITRKDGKWSMTPETAVFVGHKVNHKICDLGYRAVTNAAAFDAWVAKHKRDLEGAKPLSLDEMVKLAYAAESGG